MNTAELKTKSMLIHRNNAKINGNNQHLQKIVIGPDIGYSSVKSVTDDRAVVFPSYAKKVSGELEAVIRADDSFNYQYRNNITGQYWIVGNLAETMLDSTDVGNTTDASVYSRYHFQDEMYRVLVDVGLGISLMGHENLENKEIHIQTGLPSEYKDRKADNDLLRSAFARDYDFSLKIGTRPWRDFKFSIPAERVYIMEQPQGTLVGIGYSSNDLVNGIDVLKNNTIIYDTGFGTEDSFAIKAGVKKGHKTYTDTAMRSVFEKALIDIKKEYPVDTKVFEIQKYLENQQIPYTDVVTGDYEYINLARYIEKADNELLDLSLKRLKVDYDNLTEYQYLIVTGGTNELRFERIKKAFEKLTTLKVIPGNAGDTSLPFILSNALGYYDFRQKKLNKATEQAQS